MLMYGILCCIAVRREKKNSVYFCVNLAGISNHSLSIYANPKNYTSHNSEKPDE